MERSTAAEEQKGRRYRHVSLEMNIFDYNPWRLKAKKKTENRIYTDHMIKFEVWRPRVNCIFSHAYNKSCEQTLQSVATERLRVCLHWTDPLRFRGKKAGPQNQTSICNNEFVVYCGWVGWGSPRRWVHSRLMCGHSSTRMWFYGTARHSQWEEKEQPVGTWDEQVEETDKKSENASRSNDVTVF